MAEISAGPGLEPLPLSLLHSPSLDKPWQIDTSAGTPTTGRPKITPTGVPAAEPTKR